MEALPNHLYQNFLVHTILHLHLHQHKILGFHHQHHHHQHHQKLLHEYLEDDLNRHLHHLRKLHLNLKMNLPYLRLLVLIDQQLHLFQHRFPLSQLQIFPPENEIMKMKIRMIVKLLTCSP